MARVTFIVEMDIRDAYGNDTTQEYLYGCLAEDLEFRNVTVKDVTGRRVTLSYPPTLLQLHRAATVGG